MHKSPMLRELYVIYKLAKRRCQKVDDKDFSRYGGRGIEFRFESFSDFVSATGYRPSKKHTLDRINNNGHYEKGNLKWSTRREQMGNIERKNLRGCTPVGKKWQAQIEIEGKNIYIGLFDTELEASLAYMKKLEEIKP
ncbi:MAG: hypothetical protein C5B59_06665 [Bacteroidetes bacterium]|nr:MAG: hypothetical protein C5B59_06665 [Bacteroidota bacterium]